MIHLTIDDHTVEAEEGKTLLEVAQEHGMEIPTLCHHPAVAPYGSCRLCVVELVEDWGSRLVASCAYPARNGMNVKTDSKMVLQARRFVIELLLARCPSVRRICELADQLNVSAPRFPVKDEPDDCILCGLCVRVCNEVMGVGAINFKNRGSSREVTTPYNDLSDTCIRCGACAFVCPTGSRAVQLEKICGQKPVPLSQKFDEGLGTRSSVYIPFPQAVPQIPVIDPNNCVHIQTNNCGVCKKVCTADAIEFDSKDKTEEIEVGTVIIATGYKLLDPNIIPEYGYGKYENVYTSLEIERMVNASGPTHGEILLRDGREPETVGIIHCVGSRDKRFNQYCSRVCCMYSLKLAHLIKERTDAKVYNFYIDMRTPGKGYEEFYERLLSEGVQFIRGRAAEVTDWALAPEEYGKLVIRAEDTLIGVARRIPCDMVILSAGLRPAEGTEEIRRLFNISSDKEGWFLERHPKLAPVSTFTDGIFLAGTCQGPKDIPDTVAQAGAAASEVLVLIDKGYVEIEPYISSIEEKVCSGCKTCISLCPFTAISFNEEKKISQINGALCKGCGVCVAACPSGAAQQQHFTDAQIFNEIEGILNFV